MKSELDEYRDDCTVLWGSLWPVNRDHNSSRLTSPPDYLVYAAMVGQSGLFSVRVTRIPNELENGLFLRC